MSTTRELREAKLPHTPPAYPPPPPPCPNRIRLNQSQTPSTAGNKVNVLERGYNSASIKSYINSKLITAGPPFLKDEGDIVTVLPYPGFLTLQSMVDRWLIDRHVAKTDLNATKLIPMALTQLSRAMPPNLVGALVGEVAAMSGIQQQAFMADLSTWMESETFAPQQVDFVPFPVAKYQSNGFYNLVLFILSFVLVIVLALPASRFVRTLVLEKEMKLREGMRMMGLSDAAYFSAFMLYGVIFYAVLAVLIALVTSRSIFKTTNFGIIFIVFFLYGICTCTFSLLISVFFSKAKTASALSAILFIGFYFPAFAVSAASTPTETKRLASLLHCTAFGLGMDLIGSWENSGAGLSSANASTVLNNWSLSDTIGMLILDTFLYGFLAWYADNVLPAPFREFGVAKPYNFFLRVDYWREVFGLPVTNDLVLRLGGPVGAQATTLMHYAPATWTDRLLCRARKPAVRSEVRAAADSSYFEEADANMKAMDRAGQCVSISKLRKEFNTPDGVKVAVNDVDLTMYEGQIFVLLGHNGAGKTTTISMMTGLIPATSGSASIFGKAVMDTTQMTEIRKHLGVCPQYDVLWPELTVEEHLNIFADIKGVPMDKKKAEVLRAITEVGLTEKANTLSSKLSGGQKRKLSVCIALCGGSKVIMLDEPTSGMDPYSRRSTWQILQNAREGRVMLLTTHFMDEADILGDRIAIMANGGVECCGSPMFLKNRYGVGYVLTIVKGGSCDVDRLLAMLRSHVPVVSVATNVGAELSLRLPLASSPSFPAMLAELDASLKAYDVASYGISITSIEDVFLKISEAGHSHSPTAAAAATGELEGKGKLALRDVGDASIVTVDAPALPLFTNPMKAAAVGPSDRSGPPVGLDAVRAAARAEQSGLQTFFKHFRALLIKRWQYTTRDGKALVYQLLFPGILIAVGLGLIVAGTQRVSPSYELSTAQFNSVARVDPNKQALPNYMPVLGFKAASRGLTVDSSAVSNFFTGLPVANVSSVVLDAAEFAGLAAGSNEWGFISPNAPSPQYEYQVMSTYLMNDRMSMAASKFGAAMFVASADRLVNTATQDLSSVLAPGSSNAATYTIMFNSTAIHSAPVFMNMINSALLAQSRGTSARITTRNSPLPYTNRQNTLFGGLLVFSAAIIMIVAFSFVASSIALFVTREREVSAKHQQLISGVSVVAYWSANFTFDLLCYYVPAVIALILSKAFSIDSFVGSNQQRQAGLVLSFLLFGPALVTFTYLLTFCFKSASSASSAVLFLGILTIIMVAACQFLSQIQSTCVAERGLRMFFRVVPTFAWGWNLIQLAFLDTLPLIDATCDLTNGIKASYPVYKALDMAANGTGLIFLAVEAFVYFGLVLLVEYVIATPLLRQKLAAVFSCFSAREHVDAPVVEDDDVVAESNRIDVQLGRGEITDSVIVSHLRKVYDGSKVAVRDLSYGLPVGEVFGFLGINGAGKTTTLQILSGDVLPSSGGARMAGFDILTQQPQVRRLLGYCPQYEALLEFLSCREHLQLYARIKGVPEAEVARVVETKLQEMDLKEYENKLAGSLSGGNKRKLSVAIALIGSPPIVFLDEPSTGMDPVARRFMWRVISKVATETKQCSIILTTHSMEEVEALCTRIGIMVGGRLRCLGSAQHLRNRHGQGYQAEVKLGEPPADVVAGIAASISVAIGEASMLLPSAVGTVSAALGNPERAFQVSESGTGWVVFSAFSRSTAPGNAIPVADFAAWWAAEERARIVHEYLCDAAFPGSTLIERNGTVVRYRLLSAEPLSALFSKLEASRGLGVTGFTLGQTTLEQIFNGFASQQEEEKGVARGFART
jgi:ATP-binding cassette subfamily A (ABC1) protein 3